MKRLLFSALFVVAGCTDLIAPADPQYEDVCVIYVAEDGRAEIPKAVFEQCDSVSVVVVKFPS